MGVRASLNSPLALSSACNPRMKTVFASGLIHELQARGIIRLCTEIWWHASGFLVSPKENVNCFCCTRPAQKWMHTLLSQCDSGFVNYTSCGFKLVQAPGVALCQPVHVAYQGSGGECQQTAEFWWCETQELMRKQSLHNTFA